MTPDVLAALRFLADNVQVTFTVRADDLRKALEAQAGGPQVLTAEQAAQYIGVRRRSAGHGSTSITTLSTPNAGT